MYICSTDRQTFPRLVELLEVFVFVFSSLSLGKLGRGGESRDRNVASSDFFPHIYELFNSPIKTLRVVILAVVVVVVMG